MAEIHDVFFSLGSNMGNRMGFLKYAMDELQKELKIIAVSSIYETEPWGYDDNTPYLNMVAWFKTDFNTDKLHELTRSVEKSAGREFHSKSNPSDYHARTLDIDILFYDQLIKKENDLEIPHPRLHLRNFVLEPFVEISGSWIHPVFKTTMKKLKINSSDKSEIKRFAEGL